MYEHKSQPLAPAKIYYKRLVKNSFRVLIIFTITLFIGTYGYHCATSPYTAWIDAFHNASMILSGMGPIITSGFTYSGKVFSSIYALFSGIVFVSSIGYVLAPAIHRFFHRLHLDK